MTSARRPAPSASTIPALSAETELGVLGSVFFDGDVPPALRALAPEVFALGKSSIIQRHILKIADDGRKVDPLALAESLRSTEEFHEIGGQPTIQALADCGVIPDMVAQHCETLRTLYAKRVAEQEFSLAAAHARNGSTPADLIAEAHAIAGRLERVATRESVPEINRLGDAVTVTWAPRGIVVTFAGLQDNGGPHAEMSVSLAGRPLVPPSRVNLTSVRGRQEFAKALGAAAPGVTWLRVVETAVSEALVELRCGSPDVALVSRPRASDLVLLDQFLTAGEPLLLYADGGSGKGYVTPLAVAALTTGMPVPEIRPVFRPLHAAGVRVGYLDWEADQDTIEGRMDQIQRGTGLRFPSGFLAYRRQLRPLADDLSAVMSFVERHKVNVLVVDSAGVAAGTEAEGSEAPMRVYAALRSLNVTPFVIAHVSKAGAEQTSATPYGSTFWKNLARSTWELKRSQTTTDVDPHSLVVAAFHRKANNTRLYPPWSLRMTFSPDGSALSVVNADLADAPDLMQSASLGRRLLAPLKVGAKTSAELAEHLGAAVDSVDRTARKLRDKGQLIALPDTRPIKWALPERREA